MAKFDRRQMLKVGLAGAGGVGLADGGWDLLSSRSAGALAAGGPTPWDAANQIIAQVQPPTFPSATFPITNYGATTTGDNTQAFRQAIAACNAAGGGHVIVPAGTWTSGAIHLLSNVDLHLEAGSTIAFSGNGSLFTPLVLTSYQGIQCTNSSPYVYAYQQTNIAVTGSGTLDGFATGAWNTGTVAGGAPWTKLQSQANANVPPDQRIYGPNSGIRVPVVELLQCTNVYLQGFSVVGAQFWDVHPSMCTNVLCDGLNINSRKANNGDGIDPEWCSNVVIQNCTLSTGDDSICIKSGRDADGRRIAMPSQNIVVLNNNIDGAWGGIGCGSEMSGGLKNVYVYNNVSTGLRYIAFIKGGSARGGYIHNVNIDTFNVSNLTGAAILVTMGYGGGGSFPPSFGGFNFSRLTVKGAPEVLSLGGQSGNPINGVSLQESTFTGITAAGIGKVSNVSNLSVHTTTVNGVAVDIGPSSSPSSAPTPLSAPLNPVGVADGAGGLTASWAPPASDGGSPITGYAVYLYGADGSTQMQVTAGTSLVFSGLASGVYHTFTVTAFNGGWGPWCGWAGWVLT